MTLFYNIICNVGWLALRRDSIGLIPRQQNFSQEAVYAKYE